MKLKKLQKRKQQKKKQEEGEEEEKKKSQKKKEQMTLKNQKKQPDWMLSLATEFESELTEAQLHQNVEVYLN